MAAVEAVSVPSLDALLSAQTVWRAGRAPATAAGGEPTGHAALDALLPQGGWPRRALSELLLPADGVGELSLLLPTIARMTRAGTVVAVVAPPYLPYAPAWQAAGVDLRFLEIVDADARNALWAFEQCLRSAACGAVLGWPLQADPQALRRLQVAADTGDCLGFAFRDRKHAANPSPAALRLEHADGAWHVRKCRGGNVPASVFPGHAGATEAASFPPAAQQCSVGAASAASFHPIPCEGRGRSEALASHWLAHRGATASCAGGPEGLGRGAVGHRREPWPPAPSLPLPSQGEEPSRKPAIQAALAKGVPAKAAPAQIAALAGLR
jgi:protein ImuA